MNDEAEYYVDLDLTLNSESDVIVIQNKSVSMTRNSQTTKRFTSVYFILNAVHSNRKWWKSSSSSSRNQVAQRNQEWNSCLDFKVHPLCSEVVEVITYSTATLFPLKNLIITLTLKIEFG